MVWGKGSTTERGYGQRWRVLRLLVMERDKWLCQCDLCLGGRLRVRPATECDHRIPKSRGGTDALDNLRAVSKACHKRISLEQRGHVARPKTRFDVNGDPV